MVQFISSLRCRLIVLVLLAVIPAFGVILHSADSHRDLTAEQVQNNALRAAREIAAEQERFFESAHQFMIMLARLPQIRENDKSSCRKILAGLLEPLYADLAVTDLKGNSICTALPSGSSLISARGRNQARVIETQDFSAGTIRTDASTGKTLLEIGYPVMDSPGAVRAVVIGAMNFSWMTRLAVERHLYPGAAYTLINDSGNVLLRYPETDGWKDEPIIAKTLLRSLASRDTEKTFEAAGADGIRRLFALSQLKNTLGGQTAYAVIDIPTVAAFEEANLILARNLIVLGVLSALALAAAWFGADVFVLRRIRDIVAATEKVAGGELGARTKLPYERSELGQMARAFDDLAQTLEQREAEATASEQQINRQRQRQKILYDLNLAVTSSLDVSTVLETLLQQLSSLFPLRAATVSWIDSKTGALKPIVHRNVNDMAAPQALPATEEGLPIAVLKQQGLLALSNAHLDPRTTNPEFFRKHGFVSYLGLPLIAQGESLGVLSFYTTEEHQFAPEEINFLNTLVHGTAMPIYNSRLYEETRNQAAALEKSNRIKDEFLGVMSHELRTPLNVIMNYAEAMKMGAFGNISSEQERGTDKILSQAGHLLRLINGILEITKIESGSVTLQKEQFDLAAFIAEARSDYMMPMDKKLTINWDYPADFPVIVSDRMKLKQIITNLIDNAIKFTDEGSVTVSFQLINQNRTLEIKVTDTGLGIPEDLLPFIFDKFHQIDSTMTRHFSGAGLGLYIVKVFAGLLEGSINATSKLGEGSVFAVRVSTNLGTPANDEQQPSPGDTRIIHSAEN
jgi:signal transduction histidine kinase/HAMP domain-containing protein